MVFDKPHDLPPSRPYDHWINLLPGTTPVVVRCIAMYGAGQARAPMCDQVGTRHHPTEHLPVLDPAIAVQEGQQVLLFLYRLLGAEQQDLQGQVPYTMFFTKLDLCSGYHQVHMHPFNVEKTMFRNHHGHFKFLIMSSGLSNAPATF